jgi:MFS family permease
VLAIVGLAVLGLGQGPGMLMAGMIVLGVPHGLTMPLASSLVADGRLAEELPSVNAYMTAVVQAVAVVLPPLLGISVGALGYRETFLVLLAPVALLGLAQVLVGRPREQRQDELARH